MSGMDDFGFTEEEKVLINSFEVVELEEVTEIYNFKELMADFMNQGYDQRDAENMASKHFYQ